MRPVVSSLVAIAIALAPVSALAAKPQKTPHGKVVKHEKSDSAEDKSENADKDAADGDKAPIVPVQAKSGHHGKNHSANAKKSALKPVVHHAHNVDLGGAGHKEPKTDHSGAIVPASMVTKAPHDKAHAKPAKAADLPKLPNPNAGKPSKGGAEKGARKATEKKHEAPNDANDGQPERDEEFADLVARIRGHQITSSSLPGPGAPSEAGLDGDRAKAKGEATSPPPADAFSDSKFAKPKPAIVRSSTPPCAKDPVEIVRGPEVERFALTKCDGSLAPLAVEQLSILIRPGGAARPTTPVAELAKKPGQDLAHGIRRVDPRLVSRLQSLVDHFSKPGAAAKIFVISGYRPTSVGSMHSTGRAIDFRVEGARNEDVVSYCKTLTDTGCGYYPNSSFVHVDVRDPGTGHVTWIDASGPGETPRYVRTWPPPESQARPVDRVSTQALEDEGVAILRAQRPLDRESPPDLTDDHPGDVSP